MEDRDHWRVLGQASRLTLLAFQRVADVERPSPVRLARRAFSFGRPSVWPAQPRFPDPAYPSTIQNDAGSLHQSGGQRAASIPLLKRRFRIAFVFPRSQMVLDLRTKVVRKPPPLRIGRQDVRPRCMVDLESKTCYRVDHRQIRPGFEPGSSKSQAGVEVHGQNARPALPSRAASGPAAPRPLSV